MDLRDSDGVGPAYSGARLAERIAAVRDSYDVVFDRTDRRVGLDIADAAGGAVERLGTLAPLYPEWLGDRSFAEAHGCRFPYIVGDMARGIATADMVIAAAGAGLLGFFGAAGLAPERVERECAAIAAAIGDRGWGSNLIHAPNEPGLEAAIVDLYLARGVAAFPPPPSWR